MDESVTKLLSVRIKARRNRARKKFRIPNPKKSRNMKHIWSRNRSKMLKGAQKRTMLYPNKNKSLNESSSSDFQKLTGTLAAEAKKLGWGSYGCGFMGNKNEVQFYNPSSRGCLSVTAEESEEGVSHVTFDIYPMGDGKQGAIVSEATDVSEGFNLGVSLMMRFRDWEPRPQPRPYLETAIHLFMLADEKNLTEEWIEEIESLPEFVFEEECPVYGGPRIRRGLRMRNRVRDYVGQNEGIDLEIKHEDLQYLSEASRFASAQEGVKFLKQKFGAKAFQMAAYYAARHTGTGIWKDIVSALKGDKTQAVAATGKASTPTSKGISGVSGHSSGLRLSGVGMMQAPHGHYLNVTINGNDYGYVAPKGFAGGTKELHRKFTKMAQFSKGRALGWLKRNSMLISGSKQTSSGMGPDVEVVKSKTEAQMGRDLFQRSQSTEDLPVTESYSKYKKGNQTLTVHYHMGGKRHGEVHKVVSHHVGTGTYALPKYKGKRAGLLHRDFISKGFKHTHTQHGTRDRNESSQQLWSRDQMIHRNYGRPARRDVNEKPVNPRSVFCNENELRFKNEGFKRIAPRSDEMMLGGYFPSFDQRKSKSLGLKQKENVFKPEYEPNYGQLVPQEEKRNKAVSRLHGRTLVKLRKHVEATH